MFEYINDILKKRTKEVVFTELKPGKVIKIGNQKLDNSFPLPILTKNVVNKVKGEEKYDIDIDSVIDGMIKVLGIDQDFKHKEKYIDFLLEFDPEIGKKIINNALYYATNDKSIEALIHLKTAYLISDDELNILYNYAKICDEISEKGIFNDKKEELFLKEAREIFEYLTERYPEFPDSYYYLGFHFALENNYTKAKKYFNLAIKNGVDENKKRKIVDVLQDIDDKSDFEEGSKMILNQRFQEGLEKLLPLEEYHNDWWNLLFFIGLAYRNLEEYDKAIDYFKRTLQYNRGHAQTFNELGISYLSNGNIKEAKETYEKALEIDKDNHELLCNLGIVHLNDSNPNKAKKYLLKAKEIKPDDEIVNAWLKKLNN